MSFQEILNQPSAVPYLQKSLRGNIPQSLLFCGPSGVGKKKAALEFAKVLNCLDSQAREKGDSCGHCAHCQAINKGMYGDVAVVDFVYQTQLEMKLEPSDPDYEETFEKELAKQQNISVDTIRHVMAQSQQKSALGGWKVFIIDEAQTLQYGTGAAGNALLKLIEEPPQKTVWILLTDKKAAMLKTILSRCQAVQFAPLPIETVEQLLRQVCPDIQDTALAARYSEGSMTRAMRVAEALEMLKQIPQGPAWPAAVAMELPRTAVAARQSAQALLDIVLQATHHAWQETAQPADRQKLQQTLIKLEKYKQAIVRNVSPAIVVETALMGLNKNVQIF